MNFGKPTNVKYVKLGAKQKGKTNYDKNIFNTVKCIDFNISTPMCHNIFFYYKTNLLAALDLRIVTPLV